MFVERTYNALDGIHWYYEVSFQGRPVYTIPMKNDTTPEDFLERGRDYFASSLTLSLKRGFF